MNPKQRLTKKTIAKNGSKKIATDGWSRTTKTLVWDAAHLGVYTKSTKIRATDVLEGGKVPQIHQPCKETPLSRRTHRGRVWQDGMGQQEEDRMVFRNFKYEGSHYTGFRNIPQNRQRD